MPLYDFNRSDDSSDDEFDLPQEAAPAAQQRGPPREEAATLAAACERKRALRPRLERTTKADQPRKKAKHAAARSERSAAIAETEDGGYALKAKGELRRQGVVLTVAKKGEGARTCLADAMFVVLCTLLPGLALKLEAVRAVLVASETKDPNQAMAKTLAADHGARLVHQPHMTGSPKSLLKETSGVFLVRLLITVPDGSSDFHYVAFDAAKALVIDNAPYVKVPEIDADDRKDNKRAIRVFFHFFPNATDIRVASVLKAVLAEPSGRGTAMGSAP